LADQLHAFTEAATTLGYAEKVTAGLASQVLIRMLIQTGRRILDTLGPAPAQRAKEPVEGSDARGGMIVVVGLIWVWRT
jgi:hypothetical protein